MIKTYMLKSRLTEAFFVLTI